MTECAADRAQFFFELFAGARVGPFVGDAGCDLRDAWMRCAIGRGCCRAERQDRRIFGTFGNGASTTVKPLASFFSVIFGRFNGRAAPGGGGVFCCASAGRARKR